MDKTDPKQMELEEAIVAWQDRWLVRVNTKGRAQEAMADLVALIATRERQARIGELEDMLEGFRRGLVGQSVRFVEIIMPIVIAVENRLATLTTTEDTKK